MDRMPDCMHVKALSYFARPLLLRSHLPAVGLNSQSARISAVTRAEYQV